MAEKKEETAETRETEEKADETSETQFKEFSKEISTKVEDVSRILAQFGTEMGEDRKQRETLSGEIGSIKEFMEKQAQSKEETDFDPYDEKSREKEILELVDKVRPANGEAYLTEKMFTEKLTNMLSVASKNSEVSKEFDLSEEELAEVINISTESGISVKEAAYDKFAERKFKTQEFATKLSEELKQKTTAEPLEPASETSFDKTGIPASGPEFDRWFAEQEKIAPGTAKQKMIDAERASK